MRATPRSTHPCLSTGTTVNVMHRERLYFATGYGLIQCVKALMSYDDEVSIPLQLALVLPLSRLAVSVPFMLTTYTRTFLPP